MGKDIKKFKLPILIAGGSLLIFLILANVFDFRDNLFSLLFPKPHSFAAVCTDTSKTFTATLSGAEEVPATTATGSATIQMQIDPTDSTRLTYIITTTNVPLSEVIGLHIHSPAAAGTEAPIAVTLFANCQSFNSPLSGEVTLPASVLQDMIAGNAYVNLHTNTYPEGEIRGQITCPVSAISAHVPVTLKTTRGIISSFDRSHITLSVGSAVSTTFDISQTRDIQKVLSGTIAGDDIVATSAGQPDLIVDKDVLVISEKLASQSAIATESARSIYIFN